MIRSLIDGKDEEINKLKQTERDLQAQVDSLNAMIQEHWTDKERLKLEPLTEEEIEKAKNDLKVNFKTRKITKKQA